MNHALRIGALAVAALALGVASAYAADATATVVPWGDWLNSLLVSAGSVAVAALAYVVNKWAPAVVKTYLTNDLIAKAVNYGLGAVEGAVAGKTLTLSSTNAVLAAAESYAVASAPTIASWLGSTLRPQLLAKLSASGAVPAEVSAASSGAKV